MKTTWTWVGLVTAGAAALLWAQDTTHQPQGNQIPGPGQPQSGEAWLGSLLEFKNDPAADHDAWLRDLKVWRAERKTRMGYDDSEYRRPHSSTGSVFDRPARQAEPTSPEPARSADQRDDE